MAQWVQVGPLTDGGTLPPYVIEAGGLLRQTLASLNGDLAHASGTLAFVYADGNNNGKYVKSGSTGQGVWNRSDDFTITQISSNNLTGISTLYTVTAADAYCYREFDTSAADQFVKFDPADTSIPDTTEVAFRKTSANHILYITTDGTLATQLHAEQTLKKFTVRKVGTTLVF